MRDSHGTARRPPRYARRPAVEPPDASGEGISVALTALQVDEIVHAAAGAAGLTVALSGLRDTQELPGGLPEIDERRFSRSLLAGLLVLASLQSDGADAGVAELARRLSMNASTTHRYLATLEAAGLIDRDPTTLRYRLAA